MIEILDVIEDIQNLLAEIVLEDVSAYAPVCTLALATTTKLASNIRASIDGAEYFDGMGENIISGDLREPVFGVHDEVIEAVITACESTENGKLKEWHIDAIMTKIVERHGKPKRG